MNLHQFRFVHEAARRNLNLTETAKAALDRYDFDSVLFPINFCTFYRENFGPQVIEQRYE